MGNHRADRRKSESRAEQIGPPHVDEGAQMSEGNVRGTLLLEILLTILLLVVGLATLQVARPIPDNAFEPLGAGFAPRAIAYCIIGLAVLNLAVRTSEFRHAVKGTARRHGLRIADTAAVLVLTGLYVWIVTAKAIPFTLSTAIFVTAAMAILFRSFRHVPIFIAVGLCLGYAIQLASSTVFYVDI